MIGHEPLIAMRRQGLKPRHVRIDTDTWPRARQCAGEWPVVDPNHPWIFVEAGDSVPRLDLRCLVGTTVFVDGADRARVLEVFDACRAAGAMRVLGHVTRNAPERETYDLLEIFDTEGVLTWPA